MRASVSIIKHRTLYLTAGQHNKREMSKNPTIPFKPLDTDETKTEI